MIRSQLSNVLDCHIKLHLALPGTFARAPFLNCQIQWTQSLFPWYNWLSAWLISLGVSVKLFVVSKCRSLTHVHVFSNVRTYMHQSGKLLDYYRCCFSLSDACDPSWHSTRDGLTYSAFAISIMAFIFTANRICVYIYWQKREELQLYFMSWPCFQWLCVMGQHWVRVGWF